MIAVKHASTDVESIKGFYYEDARDEEFAGIEEIYGWENGGYERGCFIVFRRAGKWFFVSDSHCSCNGYSWSPQEITPQQLAADVESGALYLSCCLESEERAEIRLFVRELATREAGS